jgi:hypothetical protein
MTHTELRAARRPLPGDADYGPYNLALDPALMDRYLRQAHLERAQVACDLVSGFGRSLARLAAHAWPFHRHHHTGPIGGHFSRAG